MKKIQKNILGCGVLYVAITAVLLAAIKPTLA
jgi:hypothetical protein